jgi:hypothetical protein
MQDTPYTDAIHSERLRRLWNKEFKLANKEPKRPEEEWLPEVKRKVAEQLKQPWNNCLEQ